MNKTDVFFPFVISTLVAGCVMSLMSGEHEHWIPIVLALVVVGGVASSNRL
jgi:hypothetical protein